MQTILIDMAPSADLAWNRAAVRECIRYGDHGIDLETAHDGRIRCFNCGGQL